METQCFNLLLNTCLTSLPIWKLDKQSLLSMAINMVPILQDVLSITQNIAPILTYANNFESTSANSTEKKPILRFLLCFKTTFRYALFNFHWYLVDCLQRCGISIEAHEYNSDHEGCFACQSKLEFLEDLDLGSSSGFLFWGVTAMTQTKYNFTVVALLV